MRPMEKYVLDKDALPRPFVAARPEWARLYDLSWKICFDNIDYPEDPNWLPQLTCMPGVKYIWQWDSCLMTFFARYANGLLPPMNNLDNLYRLQRADGYVSMTYEIPSGREAYGERVNPPLFAWAEWEYFKLTGDDSRFPRILPVLEKYYGWLKANRRRACGLYWFEDTGSSGMDNSPRSGYPAHGLKGSDVCFVDLVCQQALSALCMSRMADRLEMVEKAKLWMKEHADLKELANERHWSEKTGFYLDVFDRGTTGARHNFQNVKTIAAFWAMLAEISDEERTDKLIGHLLNPGEFWTPHPAPSLSKDDPNYDSLGGYWLGGVWPPANYMIACGLRSRGRPVIARELAVRHLDAMCEVMDDPAYGGVWECYAPEHKRPASKGWSCDIVRSNFVGWGGLGPICMLIEDIIGMTFDAAANTVSWNIFEKSRHGIENIRFNGAAASFECSEPRRGERRIKVRTDKDIRLLVKTPGSGDRPRIFDIKKGESEITTDPGH